MHLFSLWWPRINIQAPELWEEVREGEDEKKTQKDCWRNPTACSDGARYALFQKQKNACTSLTKAVLTPDAALR